MSSSDAKPTQEQTDRIRALNDKFRQTHQGGRFFITSGVSALPAEQYAATLRAVMTFKDFTPDNDPRGEHDFGSVQIEDQTIFWKIDYYDQDMLYHSPDPADPEVTRRVLTVMLGSEY